MPSKDEGDGGKNGDEEEEGAAATVDGELAADSRGGSRVSAVVPDGFRISTVVPGGFRVSAPRMFTVIQEGHRGVKNWAILCNDTRSTWAPLPTAIPAMNWSS